MKKAAREGMKVFYVFQDWVAVELSALGFNYIVREDLKDKTKMVYIFKDCDEVRKAFNDIMNAKL